MEIIPLKASIPYSSCCYLLISGEYFSVIDPSVSYGDALRQVPKITSMTPKYVILTHAHVDHFWEISSYTCLGMQVLVSSEDGEKLCNSVANAAFLFPDHPSGYSGEFTAIDEGSTVDIGADRLEVIKTPGHTSGCLCFITDRVVFTGDTLFDFGWGRCDLPTGNEKMLFLSLERLFKLSEQLLVYPGHGRVCTIKEAKFNFDYYKRNS